jgi:hypothetical protein
VNRSSENERFIRDSLRIRVTGRVFADSTRMQSSSAALKETNIATVAGPPSEDRDRRDMPGATPAP